ncbi:ferritin-like domain-containing protein [Cerasicoccus fimbriatus]|uniref:ferritin-like domain-containing protein n=1 Tax=Cerasicoccus fimbriatus TaxID=3014554 RepID=UPI0022B2C1D0|nr:ferritin-like domain-containing protein [Cerasicoccus sp. TK19100]
MQSLNNLHNSSAWIDHFKQNGAHTRTFDWQTRHRLPADAIKDIATSIAEFQRGESSEGRYFMHVSAEFAKAVNDPEYLRATELFIAEENRHGDMLARFLAHEEQTIVESTHADSIFRWLRTLGGMEGCIMVLVTAEFIAQVYYPALRDATDSPLLRDICEQIIEDEVHHIRFQMERLALFALARSWMARKSMGIMHAVLMTGATGVVWANHRKVFRRANLGFFRYVGQCYQRYTSARLQVEQTRTRWINAMTNSSTPADATSSPRLRA